MQAGPTLSAFDWAVVGGGAALLGFFLRRFVTTMDKLDAALNQLRLTLAEEYVTKKDMKEFKEDIQEMLRMRFERIEALCPMEDCPAHGFVRKEPRT